MRTGSGEGDSGRGAMAGQIADEVKRWADAIKATAEAIDAAAGTIERNATRSVILEVNNTSSRRLSILGGGDHDWGGFRKLPPETIPPRSHAEFTSQSNSPLTGTEGSVQYGVDDEGTVFHLEWSNPFVGDNACLCRVEGAHADFYATNSITGGGNTAAHMRFILGENADASKRDPDWRTCLHCKTLFYAREEGFCPARPRGVVSAPTDATRENAQVPGQPLPGGLQSGPRGGPWIEQGGTEPLPDPATAGMEMFFGHEAAGYTFQLPYGIPGPNRMEGWRRCRHCVGLFYAGGEGAGNCPGRRGGHEVLDEWLEYVLPFGVPPREAPLSDLPAQQGDWRFCDRCFGLFYYPQNEDAVCAAGDRHHAASDGYVLDRSGG